MNNFDEYDKLMAEIETNIIFPSEVTITNLDCLKSLKFGLEIAEEYFRFFVSDYSELSWVEQWIKAASNLQPIDYSMYEFDFWSEDHTDSLSRAFVEQGIEPIDAGLQAYYGNSEGNCHELISNGIFALVGSRLRYIWKKDNPENFDLLEKNLPQEIPHDLMEKIHESRRTRKFALAIKETWDNFKVKLDQASK